MMDKTCEACRYFRVKTARDDSDDVGICRLEKRMGVFRASMRACSAFTRQGEVKPSGPRTSSPRSRRSAVGKQGVDPRPAPVDAEALTEALMELEPEELKTALLEGLGTSAVAGHAIGRSFSGGTLTLVPTETGLKTKSLPVDQFLHKMVMIRDNLRVLEQKINTHGQLQDGERLDLHQHLLRAQRAVAHMGSGWAQVEEAEILAPLRALLDELAVAGLSLPTPALAERWAEGEVVFAAGEVEIREPMQPFFFRLVQVRDALMTLEAHLSAHPHISADEAGSMCTYLRRCYGTLTSFNLLFHERGDYFASQR